MAEAGAIDCDVHPTVPDVSVLLPHLDTFWRDSVVDRGLELARIRTAIRRNRRSTSRPEWRGKNGLAATDVAQLADQVFGRWQAGTAILQLPLRRAASVQRGHGGGVLPRGQRLDREGMARPRSAAARLDRGADAEHRIRGRRDRALRQGQALRAGPGAGDAGGAARAPALLADLRGLRASRPAARHPRRLGLPQSGDLARLADLVHRGLRRPRRRASSRRSRA